MTRRVRTPYIHRMTFGRSLSRVVLLLALAAPAAATVVERMSLERVVKESALIVHAQVLDVRSGRDADGLAATWITLAVTRTLKGPHRDRLVVKQFGVAEPLPDGVLVRVAGLPRWTPGEETVLFLRGESRRGFSSPVGLAQGVYRVERRGGQARARSDTGAGPTDVDDLLGKVTRLVEAGQ